MRKHLIYLASGSSRRFGGNKLLYELEGKPLYRYGLDTLLTVTAGRQDCTLTVVSRYAGIRNAAAALGAAAVDSPDSQLGISHSIRAGLKALGAVPAEDYVLFAVADQPYLTVESLERLLMAVPCECASLCYGNRPGNPALFSASLIPELLALEGDTGGRAVLRRHSCVFVSTGSARELEDIDVRTGLRGSE